jgi:asparagine synthase (glutamine-hydrolysing)
MGGRWLAGVFDPGGPGDASVPARALPSGGRVQTLSGAGLALAYTGPPAGASAPLCLLDGHLDNGQEIARELGLDEAAGKGPGRVEELLAIGYRHWGTGLLQRMRGDFVLLVWDEGRGEGLLARDQLGVRPLFLRESGGVLRFAGEVRHLLDLLPSRLPPDRAGVAHWVAVSSRPGTETLYAGVRRLGSGEALAFGRRGARASRYWAPRFREPLSLPPEQLARRVRDELERSVRRRLSSDGLTGVLTSGGLDSASVAALSATFAQGRVRAFSGTFPEHAAADESELIGELTQSLGLGGMVASVRPGGLLASALEHLAAWRMPLLGWGDFWTLPLMRAAAEGGVETMLDGDGGDELFGPRSYLLADRLLAGHPAQAFALARQLPGAGANVRRRDELRMVARLALAGSAPYRLQSRLWGPVGRRQAPAWLRRSTVTELVDSDDPFAWKRLDGPRWWSNAAYGVAYGIEQVGVFEHQRRRAALAGLEARHPMLDLDLVELCLRQPPEETLDPRLSRPVLRSAMAGLVPDSIRLRPAKALFESLIVSCLTGPDAAAVRGVLTASDAELGGFVDLAKMRQALFETDVLLRAQPFRWMWHVWRLLNAELWLRAQNVSSGFIEPNWDQGEARISILAG